MTGIQKYVPKVVNNVEVPGEFVLADATVVDVLNPLVPLVGAGPSIARSVLLFILGRIS